MSTSRPQASRNSHQTTLRLMLISTTAQRQSLSKEMVCLWCCTAYAMPCWQHLGFTVQPGVKTPSVVQADMLDDLWHCFDAQEFRVSFRARSTHWSCPEEYVAFCNALTYVSLTSHSLCMIHSDALRRTHPIKLHNTSTQPSPRPAAPQPASPSPPYPSSFPQP